MGVQHSPYSRYGQEMRKWDTPRNVELRDESGQGTGVYGMKCVGYEPFPKMLYRAIKKPNGAVVCMEAQPDAFGWQNDQDYARACLQAEQLSKSCQRVVKSADEQALAEREGWKETPQLALAHFEGLERDIANAAAEANFHVRRMSATAQAEHAAATDATPDHVVDVKPRKKRGRPFKGGQPVTGHDAI